MEQSDVVLYTRKFKEKCDNILQIIHIWFSGFYLHTAYLMISNLGYITRTGRISSEF
jgi:hypothetical protein